jgi:lipopolysaccharide transport system ATP-binding protein
LYGFKKREKDLLMSSKSLFKKPSILSQEKSRGEEAQPTYPLSKNYKSEAFSGQSVQEADDVAIRVQNLCKCYQIYDQPQDRLKQWIYPRLQRFVGRPSKQYFAGFWALREVSFEVKKGETVGIIGRNGSGKSTLLQMICGTLTPTSGSILTHGRIAALLELGSGFNAEFTGRENVYMNAAVLGLSRAETDARIATVEFAGIVSPGLYQLNVVIPDGLAPGDHEVIASVGGVPTSGGGFLTVGP